MMINFHAQFRYVCGQLQMLIGGRLYSVKYGEGVASSREAQEESG
jgi:hypothetical protein